MHAVMIRSSSRLISAENWLSLIFGLTRRFGEDLVIKSNRLSTMSTEITITFFQDFLH